MFWKNRRSDGFTLVEIMVVVSSVGIIMMIVVGAILQTMKVQNRNEAISKLSDEGNRILGEFKRNIFNSSGKMSCQSDKLSVGTTNLFDGLTTVISCDLTNNRIASTSGTTVRKLNANGINVVSCSNFVTCETIPDTNPDIKVSSLTFNFGIETKVSGIGASQIFSTTLTVRN